MRRSVSHQTCRAKIAARDEAIARLGAQCMQLAMLSAPTPQFSNPFTVCEAMDVRDYWLKVANESLTRRSPTRSSTGS